tara:strand:+ start:88 stop:1092 length:1005 start_codon:yes stop_codon:yes gene_type:complete
MANKKTIFITGGAGYVGTRLVPVLLKKKFKVIVFDTMYFGCFLKKNKNLKIIKGDIRDQNKLKKCIKNVDILLHLACISNDASYFLNKKLSKTINMDAFEPLVKISKNNGVKRFIYASTSSVYGISKKKNITENHPLLPLTLYNKYKGKCEPLLFKHTSKNFEGVVFRPATVFGYSPRMRLDLTVNILTNFAYHKKFIKVFGGEQLRPNLHILDYCRVVLKLIHAPSNKIVNQIFNVGYANLKVIKIAEMVKENFKKNKIFNEEIKIIKEYSDDKRSYHINSDKIKRVLNFKPRYSLKDGISELVKAFKNKKLKNTFTNINYFNVKKLIKNKIH